MQPPGPHEQPPRRDPNERVIHATCSLHGGARDFTNLVVTKRGGEIELNPHAYGACLITLNEDAARVLLEALGEWLG